MKKIKELSGALVQQTEETVSLTAIPDEDLALAVGGMMEADQPADGNYCAKVIDGHVYVHLEYPVAGAS